MKTSKLPHNFQPVFRTYISQRAFSNRHSRTDPTQVLCLSAARPRDHARIGSDQINSNTTTGRRQPRMTNNWPTPPL